MSAPFRVHLATSEADLLGAQRLRYTVFVDELGGDGPMVDHSQRFERDRFDPYFDHLVLVDERRSEADLDHVVGVYRLLRGEAAARMGRFYSDDEYDLQILRASGRKLLEMGRSCLHTDYRGGAAMVHLWGGVSDYVVQHGVEVIFGVASFHGTDVQALAAPLSLLHHRHLAPEDLRVRSRAFQPMDLIAAEDLDRVKGARETPALIKGYLRMGGYVGEGAFVDRAFNTTDVCLVMDVARQSDKHRAFYSGAARQRADAPQGGARG